MNLPAFDVSVLIEEDNRSVEGEKPFRFGKGFDLNLKTKKDDWENVENGYVWSMDFYSKGARSINFVLEELKLSEGTELYIVNNDKTVVYGPVTQESNTKGRFLTDLIPGDQATLLIFDSNKNDNRSSLTIKRVVHGYREHPTLNEAPGASLECNNDIECHSGWDFQSDAVALVLLANGEELCTGSLLMTTDQSFLPYLLTAFHCIDVNLNGVVAANELNDAEDWMFKFQFKRTQCSGGVVNWGVNYNSATFRAAWNTTDFALMELDNSPAGNDQISWLGWDRTGNVPTSGTNIHHPRGDVMKISFDNNNLVQNIVQINWVGGQVSPPLSHWTAGLDNGTMEGGSSGSPLFDQNRRVVGQLHGGLIQCAPTTAHYGQFDNSWNGGGTDDTRLSNWLDPCGTGALTADTSRSPNLSGPNLVCTSGDSFTVGNLPAGSTINWSNSGNLTRNSSQGANPCTFSATGSSNGWIDALITTPCGTTATIRKHILVGSSSPNYIFEANHNTTFCKNTNYLFEAIIPQGADPNGFVWFVTDPNGTQFYPQHTGHRLPVTFTSSGNYMIGVRASNACGLSDPTFLNVMAGNCGGWFFSVYPNPSDSELFITSSTKEIALGEGSAEPQNTLEVLGSITLELYDFVGNRIINQKFNKIDGSPKLDVSHLKKGIYILKIKAKEVDETHQVIIK